MIIPKPIGIFEIVLNSKEAILKVLKNYKVKLVTVRVRVACAAAINGPVRYRLTTSQESVNKLRPFYANTIYFIRDIT